jgi:hypothetical protein
MVLINRPLGLHAPYFFPEQTGRDYVASRYLKHLEPHRHDFTVFSGVSHLGYAGHGSGAGLLTVVLDGQGRPLAITETTEVRILAFNQVDEQFAREEGEGDRTLAWWRQAHWSYFQRTLPRIGRSPAEDMPLVCERFPACIPGVLAPGCPPPAHGKTCSITGARVWRPDARPSGPKPTMVRPFSPRCPRKHGHGVFSRGGLHRASAMPGGRRSRQAAVASGVVEGRCPCRRWSG